MANARYDKFAEYITAGNAFNWGSDTIKAALVVSAYTPALTTHQFLSDLGANTVGTDQTLGSKTNTAGKLTSAAVTWTAVASGSTVRYIALYKSTGTSTTSPLILLMDTTTGVTLPVSTNGGDITYTPDATNGWIKI